VTPSDYPCPSCGFEVFSEPPGSYEICPLCGWEDDHVQLKHPAMGGGANKLSLAEHQRIALATHPASEQLAQGYRRASHWRPLLPTECQSASAPSTGHSYFVAATEEAPAYYWLRSS